MAENQALALIERGPPADNSFIDFPLDWRPPQTARESVKDVPGRFAKHVMGLDTPCAREVGLLALFMEPRHMVVRQARSSSVYLVSGVRFGIEWMDAKQETPLFEG